MKRLWMALFTTFLFTVSLPITSLAMEEDDPEFTSFLKEIGWKKQSYIDYLESKDWDLDFFDTVDELGTPLSEADIQPVLDQFRLTRDELNALLVEFGDIEEGQDVLDSEWIIFAEELGEYVDHYLNDYTAIDDKNLQELLTTYDLQSIEDLEALLAEHDDALEYYTYIEDLKWTVEYYLYELVETPVNEENLVELLEMYEFSSREELEQFLKEHGDSIENYEFIEDLDYAVYLLLYGDDFFDTDEVLALVSEIGITEEELERLTDHFFTLDLEDPALLEKLLELENKLVAFETLEYGEELTKSQIAEFTQIYQEVLQLFQIDVKYYLIKGDEKNTVSFDTLMTMYSTNGYDFVIEIYNNNGDLLADLILTSDLLEKWVQDINGELDITNPLLQKEEDTNRQAPKKADAVDEGETEGVHTVHGGKLPDTASFIGNHVWFGLLLFSIGAIIYYRAKRLSRR